MPGITLAALRVTLSGNTRLALIVLFCAVCFVLLIIWCSLAVQLESRKWLCAALGAGGAVVSPTSDGERRPRHVRGGIGLLLASLGMHWLVAIAPADS